MKKFSKKKFSVTGVTFIDAACQNLEIFGLETGTFINQAWRKKYIVATVNLAATVSCASGTTDDAFELPERGRLKEVSLLTAPLVWYVL